MRNKYYKIYAVLKFSHYRVAMIKINAVLCNKYNVILYIPPNPIICFYESLRL